MGAPIGRSSRIVAGCIGLLLLGAAAWAVLRQQSTLQDAATALRATAASPRGFGLLGMLVAGILANLVLTGLMLSALMKRFGRVGLFEMQALTAAATLLNYLPLKPGMFGRVAYHKAVNQIPVRSTAVALITAVVLGMAVATACGAAIWSQGWLNISFPFALGIAGAAPPAILGVIPTARRLCLPWLLRFADVLAWSARYWAAFALLEHAITWEASLALACIATLANSVPFIGNGLGLREWAIGLATPRLLAGIQLEWGLSADLVNRGVEVVVVLIGGLLAMAWLARKR